MRLRIQSFSPLPELKAWFILETNDAQETVLYLKKLLCMRIPQLTANHIHPENLILLLDGFELLGDSPISVVRDGDLIVVKMEKRLDYAQTSGLSQKRKRSFDELDRLSNKKFARRATTRQIFSIHQDSEDESSSDSESTTSESSSEETTTSSASPPTVIPINKGFNAQPTKASKTTYVPPGQGKPSTHSRNQRRKKKREHEKLAKPGSVSKPTGIPEGNHLPLGSGRAQNVSKPSSVPPSSSVPQPSSSTNIDSLTQEIPSLPQESNISLGRNPPQPSSSNYVYITSDQVTMGSLRNKNKKKGFKQSMTGPIPRKIVFPEKPSQDQGTEPNPALDDYPPQISETNQSSSRHLIPPSEMQRLGQLPPNVFVTSVDVEQHIWGSSGGLSKKKKNGKKQKHVSRCDDDSQPEFEDNQRYGGDRTYIDELPYDDGVQAEGAILVASNDVDSVDWEKAEKLWDASSSIQDIQRLTEGVVVGWKELAISPLTFTPEMLLFLARIIACEAADDNPTDASVLFRQIRRLGASEAAVAFGVVNVGGEEAESEGMEECVAWSDVLKQQWRVVDL